MKQCYNSGCLFSVHALPHDCACAEMCEHYTSGPCLVTTSNCTQPSNGCSTYSNTTGLCMAHTEGSVAKESNYCNTITEPSAPHEAAQAGVWRGDIYYVDFGSNNAGSIMRGMHPAMVISNKS